VQAIFDQTWARLPEPLQRALARLSVFPAGCTREVALAVADASLPLLSQLVERAILQRAADGRYLLHPLLRQYAAQRLRESPAEAEAVAEACGRHYTAWLCSPFERFFADGAVEAMTLVRAEHDNLRSLFPAILAHAGGEPLRRVLQLVQNVYFACGPYQEWVELMEAAEAHLRSGAPAPEREAVRAHALTSLGFFALRQGRIEAAQGYFTESNALFAQLGATPRMGSATDPELGLGMLAMVAGDYRAAGRYAERARARSEASGQRHNQAYAWYVRAEAAQAQGLLPAARTAARKALALAHTSGATWLTAYTRNQLGRIATALGRYDEAEGHYQASYATREAFHDAEGMAAALLGVGEVAARRGELERAGQHYRKSVALFAQAGDRGGTARARLGLGRALTACGDHGAAWREIQVALAEARALDFQHVVLDALVQAAALLVASGRVAEAIAPLTQALVHPACQTDTSRLAEDLLVRCEELAPAGSFAAETARGREIGLDLLADELLAMSAPSSR
jgi:tetratricopeptide (TPR) repeat protein